MFGKIHIEKYAKEIRRDYSRDMVSDSHNFRFDHAYEYYTRIVPTITINEDRLDDLIRDANTLSSINLLQGLGWTIIECWKVSSVDEQQWLKNQTKNDGGKIREFTGYMGTYLCFEKSETAALHQLTWR